jgi:hypothetical protein
MPTSFPYLAVAKQYGVDYWRVLQFADLIDEWPPKPEDWALDPWKVATCLAWKAEDQRRKNVVGLNTIVTVRGDCGVIHDNVEQWQNCSVCASIAGPALWLGLGVR